MKKIKLLKNFCLYVVITTLVFFSALFSEIIETTSMKEIYHYLDSNRLIILDIDNTLMEPVQDLGTDQWFYHHIDYYKKSGMSQHDAKEKALAEWEAIQHVTKVQVVESGTAEIVKDLQDRGYTVMGLTTRGLTLSTRTIHQLLSIGIDLSRTPPTHDEIFFINEIGILFRGGILFTSGTNKGNAFCKFLDCIHLEPTSILFVNDKENNIRDLMTGCQKRMIPFIGLRYGFIDEKVNNFSPEISDIQFEHFGHILSNEDAHIIKTIGK